MYVISVRVNTSTLLRDLILKNFNTSLVTRMADKSCKKEEDPCGKKKEEDPCKKGK
jgi:hypothetical protein